jgi:signal transduction histidine kinase/CheY-like chemotaxis protein
MKKILNKLINLGVADGQRIEESQKIRLTNILAIFPAPIYLYFFLVGLNEASVLIAGICLVLLTATSFSLYCNYKKKYILAKSLNFIVDSFCVFLLHNSMNANYSAICFFFPILIAYEIIFDIKSQFKFFLPNILFTALCIAACFLLPNYIFTTSIMPESLAAVIIRSNYIFSILLSASYLYAIISMHTQTQEKLVFAMKGYESAIKAKSNFLSNMSHELRTPLNGIIGATNLLMHETATSSQKKYYDVLQHTSDHMLNLVNHILDFSKINEGKINLDRNIFNLKHTISKLCRVYQAQNTQEHVVFSFEIDNELDREIISDDLRLKQIIYNLLSNAFKFTKQGTIILGVKLLRATADKMGIKFYVTDTGVGIKPEQLEKIFESFEQADNSTTRNFGGTGLGLSISKQLVALFGATLHVESTYQVGSTFSFEIEVEINKEISIKETAPETKRDLHGIKILVAEDNKVNMMVLLTFLKKWNVAYTDVVNGSLALEAFKNNDYSLILMDLEMPEMDGYTAIKEIRKHDTTIPVIAFTAALYDNMITDLKSKGFDGYLQKPYNPTDLYNKISKYATATKQA